MEIKYLIENATLTQITKYLNEHNFEKKTKREFTTNDVNQYISLGHLPYYMGGNVIDSSDLKVGVKLYSLRK